MRDSTADPLSLAILHQAAGRGQEIAVGVFRIDAGFHRQSAQLDVALLDGERLAGGDADHLLDEIDAGDEVSDPCPATNSTIPAEAYPTAWPRGELAPSYVIAFPRHAT